MCPRSGFIVNRSAARCIITLFDRGILQPQERLNHASAGRLRGREDELRAVNCTAVIGSGEVNNRRATNGCTNDNGDDKNDAAGNHLVPRMLEVSYLESNYCLEKAWLGYNACFIITMIIRDIHSPPRSAHGFEPGPKPGVPSPLPSRPCYGLTSAIPPGTSFSKVKVGRPSSHRAGCPLSLETPETPIPLYADHHLLT